MTLQVIVEGHGEVGAVPVLLRRLQTEAVSYSFTIGRPHRRTRTELAQEQSFWRALRIAAQEDDCAGILVLLDGDDDCPAQLGPQVEQWAGAENLGVRTRIVVAWREFEAWFLAAAESLGADADHPNPERPRAAKDALARLLSMDYSEPVHQPRFAGRISLANAWRNSRSFRRLVNAFGLLHSDAGVPLADWPPSSWPGQAK